MTLNSEAKWVYCVVMAGTRAPNGPGRQLALGGRGVGEQRLQDLWGRVYVERKGLWDLY